MENKQIGRRRRLTSPFSALYDEAGLLPVIRRSLLFVIFGNICGNTFGTITTGTALTGYAEALGANDFVFGVLTGIPLAANLFQIPAAMLVSRTHKRKQYMLTYGLIGRALWILAGLVPYFMPAEPAWLPLWTVIFLVGMAASGCSFINVCFTPWLADLVPLRIRGRWMGLRDGINAVVSMSMGLVTAYLLDTLPSFTSYTVVFAIAGVVGALDMCCFIGVKEVHSAPPVKVDLWKVCKQIVHDKPFFTFMLFWTAWCFTANLSGPFLIRYALGDMGLSYMQVTLCSQIAAALITILVISFWGKLLDRYGNKPVLWVSCVAAALTPAFFCFSVPGSIWPTLLHNVIGAAFWSAANLSASNMQLSYSPDDQRPTYIAIYSCVANLFGSFLGVICGGALLEGIHAWVDANAITLAGAPLDYYKVVFVISVIARLGIVLFFLPRMKNDNEHTTKDMLRDLFAPHAKAVPRKP